MFIGASLLVALAFVAVAILVPLQFPLRAGRLLESLRARFAKKGGESIAFSDACVTERRTYALRAWGFTATLIFAALLLADAGWIWREDPLALIGLVCYAAFAASVSGLIIAAGLGCWDSHAAVQSQSTLSRSGVNGLWIVDSIERNAELGTALRNRAIQSTRICISHVTGYDLLGKGPGRSGGVIYDALNAAREVPVFVTLCKPTAEALDPERRKISVLQNLLAELKLSQNAYVARIKATMEAIAMLNQSRPEEGQIRVRFYGEKPSFRTVIFDDSCFSFPWSCYEERVQLPYLEFARESAHTSLFESFRRHFARLWGTPLDVKERRAQAGPLSESFAVRPATKPRAAQHATATTTPAARRAQQHAAARAVSPTASRTQPKLSTQAS